MSNASVPGDLRSPLGRDNWEFNPPGIFAGGAVAATVDEIMGYARPKWIDSILFFMLMSGPPRLRLRDPGASLLGEVDWLVAIHASVWAFGALWLCFRLSGPFVRHGVLPRAWLPQIIGLTLAAVFAASAVYSPGPLLTAFVAAQTAIMLAFTWVFVRIYGVRCCLQHLFWSMLILALAIYVALVFAPDMVRVGPTRVRGDLIAPTGQVAVAVLILALCAVPKLTKWMFLLIIPGMFFLLWLSETRTAFIAFAAFICIGAFLGRGLPVKRILPFLIVGGIVVAGMDAIKSVQAHVVRDEESISSLSDRIPLWTHMTGVMLRESPLVGLGFYASSRVVGRQYNDRLGTAHSAFFEVFIGAGILGGGLYVLLIGALGYYALIMLPRAYGNGAALASIGLFAFVLIVGITGSDPMQAGPSGFVFWAVAALFPALREEHRAMVAIAATRPMTGKGSLASIRPSFRFERRNDTA